MKDAHLTNAFTQARVKRHKLKRGGGLAWEMQRQRNNSCGVLDWRRIIVRLHDDHLTFETVSLELASLTTYTQAPLSRQISQAAGRMACKVFRTCE
jgi:hypothetical protein